MRIVIYDCEVFAHDWLVCFKDVETGARTRVWNDNEALKMAINEDVVYVGFNSKHYDQFIIKAIAADFTPKQIKQLNDYLIEGNQGWTYEPLRDKYFDFINVDIRDDMQMGLSLKAIECHLGMNIKETEVSFNIDRPLTEDEKKQVQFYCDHDVDATEEVFKLRKDYLKNKINVGKLAGLSPEKSMSMTNAKLTAAMLKAELKPHDDERKYVYPDNLLREYIPQEVFDYFNKMYDESIPDEILFKEKLEITIRGCPITLGFGGIHGALRNYFFDHKDKENRVLLNQDVGSYYPHLMTLYDYTSRNIPSASVFKKVLATRMEAKAKGDKVTTNALKLVVNTTYGAMLNKYNPLYDPLMGRSVCISGQLFLLELAQHLCEALPTLTIVQLNTDGIMIECDKSDVDVVNEISKEWQSRTGFTLEDEEIIKLAQKDVNNYVEVQPDEKIKAKGGYLVKGLSTAGAFNVNNSCVIVATALKEYFTKGIPVEETIMNCDDLSQFQIIAKAGSKYSEVFQLVDDQRQSVQKVNRVYASKNKRFGKLYKVKASDGSIAKIESLPEHCLIDNDNQKSIEEVDKDFYIEMARKRVDDFIGIKPEKISRRKKEMATKKETKETNVMDYSKMNVYQKLILARKRFLEANVDQSGKNMKLEYKYFELKDIVPTVTNVFNELGLIALDNFSETVSTLTVVNCDQPEEVIDFVLPFKPIEPIVSNTGKQVTNDMQALGSSITYMRRYLYLVAMDICVNDEIEPTIDNSTNKTVAQVIKPATPVTPAKPATPVQRNEIKKELTDSDVNADELQIKGLKNVLVKLREKSPEGDEVAAKIAVQTQGFKIISKADCEALITRISDMLDKLDKGEK